MSAKFTVGVDYYPEQWPQTRWATDAALMRDAGFNVVRLAEFAWVKLEPALGEFDFDWLDRAIEILSAHGLTIVLGTPTATMPAWVMALDPSMYRVSADGRAASFGHRRGYCPHHVGYRRHAERIVSAMAAHYANHPAVIGWQIDNEFGDRSYSAAAQVAFQGWLEKKYATLEAMNDAWGTVFWSQTYTAWSEVPAPLDTGGPHNPGLALDFARFSSDGYVSFQREQLEIIRAACPNHFITHNLMGFGYDQIDYFDLAADLDFVTWDNYPRMWWNVYAGDDAARAALGHATMRGLKQQSFWVMEQQAGAGGWQMVVPHPRPGELRLWAYQAIAHGADGIVFFRFRTARHGTEQYWHGLLEHDGTVGRRYLEAKTFGLELQKIGAQVVGSVAKSSVALLNDYNSRFALQIQPNNPELQYASQFSHWYSALHRRNVGADIISSSRDLSAYKIVIAPLLHVVTPAAAANLERFVRGGGTLVLTARSGVKDGSNAVVNEALPGLLRDLAGGRVTEYNSLIGSSNGLRFDPEVIPDATDVTVNIWCDLLEPSSARVLARYTGGFYAGAAAITQNRVGRGSVIYVGAIGDAALPETLLKWLLSSQLTASLGSDKLEISGLEISGLEITERWQGETRLRFYLNHSFDPQSVTLGAEATSLLTGRAVGGTLTLEGFGVEILTD